MQRLMSFAAAGGIHGTGRIAVIAVQIVADAM